MSEILSFWVHVYFQDSGAELGMRIHWVFGLFMSVVSVVIALIMTGMYKLFWWKGAYSLFETNHDLEVVWGAIPFVVLMALCVPSTSLLFAQSDIIDPSLTVKCIGRQWYWQYEYTDHNLIAFDSYMVKDFQLLKEGDLRLLAVDNPIVIPFGAYIRILVTSADVIHCWAVPGLGVKVDGVPGRLSEVPLIVKGPGVYWGQCSEICGANHSFIPIRVDVVDCKTFVKWQNTIVDLEL